MPISKTKLKNAAIAGKSAALPKIPKELLDQFVSGPMSAEAVNAASMAFKKALIERALGAELGHDLGYPSGAAKPKLASNPRNGRSEEHKLAPQILAMVNELLGARGLLLRTGTVVDATLIAAPT